MIEWMMHLANVVSNLNGVPAMWKLSFNFVLKQQTNQILLKTLSIIGPFVVAINVKNAFYFLSMLLNKWVLCCKVQKMIDTQADDSWFPKHLKWNVANLFLFLPRIMFKVILTLFGDPKDNVHKKNVIKDSKNVFTLHCWPSSCDVLEKKIFY